MHASMSFPRVEAPPLAQVRQKLPSRHIADVYSESRSRLLGASLAEKVRHGDRIGITAGSRGMGGFVDLLRGVADAVRACGGEPFILPAMGSHGGAIAEGQTEILRLLGLTDGAVDAPIRSTMETRELGRSATGAAAHLDEIAAQADGVIVLARVKTHPESAEGLASGLLKMTVVGLGKQKGAQEAHSHGLWDSIREVPKLTLAGAKVLCGVAVVENAFREPVALEVVPGSYEAFLDADQRLLNVARQHLATLPCDHLDLLVVDEMGKSISGTGMDLNVIGSWRMNGGEKRPDIRRIVPLSLTEASLGNALGIGLADFTTRRLAEAYDPDVTYVNLLTAAEPGAMNTAEGGMPLALPSDREAIEVALYSALPARAPRVCRIRNTALLGDLWVSEPLLAELQGTVEVVDGPGPLPYDADGNLF